MALTTREEQFFNELFEKLIRELNFRGDALTSTTFGALMASIGAASTGNWTFSGNNADLSGAAVMGVGLTTASSVSIGKAAGFVSLLGNVRAVAGTVGAPAYTFTSDLVMGMYRGGANQLRFTTDGDSYFEVGTGAGYAAITSGIITCRRTGGNQGVVNIYNGDDTEGLKLFGGGNGTADPQIRFNDGTGATDFTLKRVGAAQLQQDGRLVSQSATAFGTDIASAGTIAPTRQFHAVTGTTAIETITVPTGFACGTIGLLPRAIFTWTTAGNIGVAGTAVVGRMLFFSYNPNDSKWYPSYV